MPKIRLDTQSFPVRLFFGVSAVAALACSPQYSLTLLPGIAINIIAPREAKWKERTLIALYFVFLLLPLAFIFLYGIIPFLFVTIIYFILMARKSWRTVTGPVLIMVPIFLLAAGPLVMFIGVTGLPIAAGACTAVAYFLIRGRIFGQRGNILFYYCFIASASLVWYFFFPAPYPSSWLFAQKGFSGIAAYDTSPALRQYYLFRQTHFIDEYSPQTLLMASKRHLWRENYEFQYALVDRDNPHDIRPVEFPRNYPTLQLIPCQNGEYMSFKDSIYCGNRAIYTSSEASLVESGFHQPKSDTAVLGDDFLLLAVDLETGRTLMKKQIGASFVLGPESNIVAPFGDEELYYLEDRKTPIIGHWSDAERRYIWERGGHDVFPLIGSDTVKGTNNWDYIYLLRTWGKIEKINPADGIVVESRNMIPGARFITLDANTKLIMVINAWLGVAFMYDMESLRLVDWMYVGQRPRQINMSRDTIGLGYVVSSVGLYEVDICRRMPDRCRGKGKTDNG